MSPARSSLYLSDTDSIVTAFQPKKPRVLSDESDDSSPVKPSSANGSNGSSSSSFSISPEEMERRLKIVQRAYPDRDTIWLQDVLVRLNWDVSRASQELGPSTANAYNAKKKFTAPKKAKLSRYSATARAVDDKNEDSESGSEGEYNDGNVVYDSDDSEEERDPYGERTEEDEANLPEDKRRVLNFFNVGTAHELAAIQGCSKKKVENIMELRPYTGWGDLVQKLQLSRNLNTDMLNHTTMLIKMRDTIARLMERCEKITRRMETMVEDLTNGDGSQLELTEQPGILSSGQFKLTGYQMIG